MSGKSELKRGVVRSQFASTIRAVLKTAEEASHNFVPRAEPDDPEQTLENVTYAVEDTGIRLHGYTNLERVHESVSETGYRVTGATGDSLYHFVLSTVKRAFEQHARLDTFVMIMSDKGPWMPAPKLYTQKNRTQALIDLMEKQQLRRIAYNPDGSAPLMVARDKVLPPWTAVLLDRVLYRHATNQLFQMIMTHYKPPVGRRLILDTVDMSAASPRTLDEWMRSDRLICDDFALEMIEKTREALRQSASEENGDDASWRTSASRVVKELAQGGHIKAVPLCIETNTDGITSVFLLPNAASTYGEADIGVQFWFDAMQANKQHITLHGARRAASLIPDAVARYYDDHHLELNRDLASRALDAPLPFVERRRRAQEEIEANQDLLLYVKTSAAVRAQIAVGLPVLETNPCVAPNRGLVMSSDTDFLSLLPIAYAQMCYQYPTNPQYCLDNAPLICMGECNTRRTGWLVGARDFVAGKKKKRKWDAEDDDDQPYGEEPDDDDDEEEEAPAADAVEQPAMLVHELYDIHRLYHAMLDKCNLDTNDVPHIKRLECILSHAMCFAACGNDYLAGLYWVNRKYTYAALRAMRGELISYDKRLHAPIVVMPRAVAMLKHAYYNSIQAARGAKNKPPKPAPDTTYNEMSALNKRKYKGITERSTKKHMPDDERLHLLLQRWQWWIVYATEGWRSVERLFDHNVWGWPAGTTEKMV